MTYAEATQYWNALSPEQKQTFYAYASKSEGNHTAFEWFNHLIPDDIKDQPEMVEVFMDGGTIVTADGDTLEIADKDLSRIQSGQNGGEYTTDNTIMEDASANRSRGSADMSEDELELVEASNTAEAKLMDSGDIFDSSELVESTTSSTEILTTTAEAGDGLAGALIEGILPVTYGAKAAHAVWKSTDHMPMQDRVATTSIAAGGAVLGTYTALAVIPGANLLLGGYAVYKGARMFHRWLNT
jgi:hypothetical protein